MLSPKLRDRFSESVSGKPEAYSLKSKLQNASLQVNEKFRPVKMTQKYPAHIQGWVSCVRLASTNLSSQFSLMLPFSSPPPPICFQKVQIAPVNYFSTSESAQIPFPHKSPFNIKLTLYVKALFFY